MMARVTKGDWSIELISVLHNLGDGVFKIVPAAVDLIGAESQSQLSGDAPTKCVATTRLISCRRRNPVRQERRLTRTCRAGHRDQVALGLELSDLPGD